MSLLRKPEDLKKDPRNDFQVGHLVGAHQHLCTHLALYGDERGREIARRSYQALAYFYEKGQGEPLPELPPEVKTPEQHLMEQRGKELGVPESGSRRRSPGA